MKRKTMKVVTSIAFLSIFAVGTVFAEQTSKIDYLHSDVAANFQTTQNNTVAESKDSVIAAEKDSVAFIKTDTQTEAQSETEARIDTVIAESETLKSDTITETNVVSTKSFEETGAEPEIQITKAEETQINQPVSGIPLTDQQANEMAYQNSLIYIGYVNEVFSLLNQERMSAGVPAVIYDSTLTLVAMHRSAENAWMDWMEVAEGHHIRPNGQKASTICNFYGLTGSYGENLGRYQESPSQIVSGWHDSAAHYACMTNTKYTRAGIGIAQDSEGYYYWTAIFMD